MTAASGSGSTARLTVRIEVAGETVVGHLHRPVDGRGHAAVIVAGPMTSVKEQVTGIYAAALARRGIAALAIDHRHFGESAGWPRQYEHHGRKVEDLRAAVACLAGQPDIDPSRLGALGVCLGVGYAAATVAAEPRLRAFAAVAGYYRDPDEMRRSDPGGFDAKVAQGREARRHFENTGEVTTIPAAALHGDAAMQTTDTVDYYTRRAVVPGYRNAFAVMSREHFVTFDVQGLAPRIGVPTLMVHGERALSPAWARRFHERLPSAAAMPIDWLESPGQTAFYDDPALVDAAADRAAAHLLRHL